MRFENIFSEKRVGSDKIPSGPRSGFQRDFDRLIFSSAFRRLQNKTQVFPLPGMAFVHNRLTHSLEVASVGRSLGKIIGAQISESCRQNEEVFEFYRYELANVIAAGCLAHDIGNPAFGHSGEKAISSYFIENAQQLIEGKTLKDHYKNEEWSDLTNFEGNANAVRLLTHSFRGRFQGGFGLTYTTIASILKYPCESTQVDKQWRHRKKYGFFQSEKEIIRKIADSLSMITEQDSPMIFKRHPFVYLVEAADDICYNIVDMEDAHRLGILRKEEVESIFLEVIRSLNKADADKTHRYYLSIEDTNEALAFLRARIINHLVNRSAEVFLDHRNEILEGRFNETLIGIINKTYHSLEEVERISVAKIYEHPTVMQVEVAGYNVMSELLRLFLPPLLKSQVTHKEEKLLKLIPYQFTEFQLTHSSYEKTLSILDYISGMTDEYATEMYRRLKGIVVPQH